MKSQNESFDVNQAMSDLQAKIGDKWQEVLATSPLISRIMNEPVTESLYTDYMTETYHYTKHNARNQALVGVIHDDISDKYRKFCFEHAEEETGHENMALHDIQSLGVDAKTVTKAQAAPATRALVDYLYAVAEAGNPYARLGYSLWAEDVYGHINPVLAKIKQDLGLKPKQMTFFVAHAEIDTEHAEEVREIIRSCVKTKEDFAALEETALKTLDMTAQILVDVYRKQVA